jgi:hypothetical protein
MYRLLSCVLYCLCRVKVSRQLQLLISDMCSRLNVDGLRGDLVINRAAKALVAYEGRDTVTQEDVGKVISACLNHRYAEQRPGVLWRARDGGGAGLRTFQEVMTVQMHTKSFVQQQMRPQHDRESSCNSRTSDACAVLMRTLCPLLPCRLRKDPLDPIDSGTKVAILFKRLTDPEFAKREEEAKKKQVGGLVAAIHENALLLFLFLVLLLLQSQN